MFEQYLLNNHRENLIRILKDEESDKHFSISVNFIKFFETNADLGSVILKEPLKSLNSFDEATRSAQDSLISEIDDELFIKKSNVHVRIYDLPACPELHRTIFPTNKDLGSFLQISGTIVRSTAAKLLEYKRDYICTKCKYVINITADYEQGFVFQDLKSCSSPDGCNGKNIIPLNNTIQPDYCKDYQEIKLQEQISKFGIGTIPSSLWVTLEDNLVDCCKPGDDITVCGTLQRRWKPLVADKKIEVELVFRANHVQVNNDQQSIVHITPEIKLHFKDFWEMHKDNPLKGRDIILASFCPQLCGLYLVKLAVLMVLAGGSQQQKSADYVKIRSEPHLLLVGDPGTGKSQLLRFASKIVPRSVFTTGIGSTSAGLTVTAVMDEGEWQLEAGALVLADEGICCIDEFNSMKEHDRGSIHEAMEQQTISVAKANIVCKLNTKCSVLAATNPKGQFDMNQPLNLNIGIASPLLSRFDVVLILRDTCDSKWDNIVCNHLLFGSISDVDKDKTAQWNTELLQAYFMIIKSLQPVLTKEANLILQKYYQYQRQATTRNAARTTVRMLDSLVRLSQAHARLMFRSKVLVMDALMAIVLTESSLQETATILPKFMDLVHTQIPEEPLSSYIELLRTILNKLNLIDLMNGELSSLQKVNGSDKPCTSSNNSNDNETPKNVMVEISATQIQLLHNNMERVKENKVAEPNIDGNKTNKQILNIKNINKNEQSPTNHNIENYTVNKQNSKKVTHKLKSNKRKSNTPEKSEKKSKTIAKKKQKI